MTNNNLNRDQLLRYSRHLLMPEIGVAGQQRLLNSSVLIIGAGGLGSPAAMYLAAAGVGRIGIVDFDAVDVSNLQRQILHVSKDVGVNKAESAKQTIGNLNSEVVVETYVDRLQSGNALEIFRNYDIVIDGSDNFPTRYLVNDACVMLNKPLAYGAVLRFEGQASLFVPGEGPCYRCLFSEPPEPFSVPSCAQAGVLGVVTGIIGSIQAAEACKWIIGKGQSLAGRLLLFDAMQMTFRELKIKRDTDCAVCGDKPTVTELIDYEHFCGMDSAADTTGIEQKSVAQLKKKLESDEPFILLDVREKEEHGLSNLPQARFVEYSTFFGRGIREIENHKDDEIWVMCYVGDRSQIVARYLQERGFGNVKNVIGGLEEWSEKIDDSIPKY